MNALWKALASEKPSKDAISPIAHHLAQANVARMRAPLTHPIMEGFVAQLARINGLADMSPGFVWRLQTEDGNATGIRAYADPRMLINMSVWQSLDALAEFTYRREHGAVFRRRAEWFERPTTPSLVLWWIVAGHIPTIDEAKERLEHLRRQGPTSRAFTFKAPFPRPVAPQVTPRVEIVDYAAEYRPYWEALNTAWLEKYFTVEDIDRKILRDPEQHVLQGGGCVLFARVDGQIVGTCGLRRLGGEIFELIKMAVADDFQRRGIGTLLARAAIERARSLGARKLVLETNSRLGAALRVYRKLGFIPAPCRPSSAYARADTALELELGGR